MFAHSISPDLSLAMLEPRYAEELFQMTSVNREHLRVWSGLMEYVRVDDTKSFIKTAQQQFCKNGGFQSAILLRGRIVGVIGFHRIDWAN